MSNRKLPDITPGLWARIRTALSGRAAIFMAEITNYRLYTYQTVATEFVIVTQDTEEGMVDIYDRRPVELS